MVIGEESFGVELIDNPTSKSFIKLLPLTLDFEDYHNIEKIVVLSNKLSRDDSPSGCEANKGAFTYYAPWGNLALFYKDFGYAPGLIRMGEIEEKGVQILSSLSTFSAHISLID